MYNSSPVFSNHDLGWETRFRQYQKQITRVQCARVRLPIQSMFFVYVYVICSACYLSVMIQLVSFPLSQYDLQLYALELFGQEWLDTPTKGRRSVLSESKRLQLGESCLENAWTSQVVT